MPFDVASIINFVKENWDELILLGFVIVQCISCVVMLFQKKFTTLLEPASIYFPALVLLVASLFFNLSWNMLSGYVLGSSLMLSIGLWNPYYDVGKKGKKVMANGFFTVMICLSLIFS